METLAKEITNYGYLHRQVKRVGDAALYEKITSSGMPSGYEVIIVKQAKETEAFGKKYPDREVYPSPEDFGTLAWSYAKLENAEKNFSELVKNRAMMSL